MQFDSLLFLVFFLVVALVYHLLSSWRSKKGWILFSSYLFYASWRPELTILLLLSTVVDWNVARRIHQSQNRASRKGWLLVSLVTNLGFLGYFKYASFIDGNLISLASLLGFDINASQLDIILPIGISFYTFQTLSYTIDVYRRDLKPESNFINFALFVSFFPQLVAGPIVRAGQFLPQLIRERNITKERFSRGATLFVFGLFSKVVLADFFLAPVVDHVYSGTGLSTLDSLTAILGFSGQIYFDFSGYTSCALGLAIILGFTLPENFKSPYAAGGFSDFWERWHISLSSWLRDYLYISLGGNRKGRVKTLINLMITMLLGGLWHGAAWNYVMWGMLHGLYLIIEHTLLNRFPEYRNRMNSWLIRAITFALVSVSWIPFRSENIAQAQKVFLGLGNYNGSLIISQWQLALIVLIIGFMFVWQQITRTSSALQCYGEFPHWLKNIILGVALTSVYIAAKEESRAFIYFQF